jgi:hypothetical protein
MEYREATTIIPHGCEAKDLKDLLKRIKEQGMPTINRRTRRQAQRVGDRARKAKRINDGMRKVG